MAALGGQLKHCIAVIQISISPHRKPRIYPNSKSPSARLLTLPEISCSCTCRKICVQICTELIVSLTLRLQQNLYIHMHAVKSMYVISAFTSPAAAVTILWSVGDKYPMESAANCCHTCSTVIEEHAHHSERQVYHIIQIVVSKPTSHRQQT